MAMQRLLAQWDRLRSSMWLVPALLTAGAFVASIVALSVDGWLEGGPLAEVARTWSGGPDGAREVLGTIAGSMITIAGVTFSIVIVALVLASNQFAPRLLHNFMGDRINQTVLGSFVATFLYALLVLRGVRTGDASYVPAISVGLALVFAVFNLGLYIYFIHHIADSMRVATITRRIARDTHAAFGRWFDRGGASSGTPWRGPAIPPDGSWPVRCDRDGYVEAVDVSRLQHAAEEFGVRLDLALGTGDFVARRAPMAWATPRPKDAEGLEERIRSALLIGAGRTMEQDPAFGVRQLVDVAVKALSPGINDPSTAASCIDYLGSLLLDLARRPAWPPREIVDDGDDRRVLVRLRQAGFAAYVELALSEIARYGRSDCEILVRLAGVLERLEATVKDGSRRKALGAQALSLGEQADEGLTTRTDRRRVERRLVPLCEALGVADRRPLVEELDR